jgi:hypothetical protein
VALTGDDHRRGDEVVVEGVAVDLDPPPRPAGQDQLAVVDAVALGDEVLLEHHVAGQLDVVAQPVEAGRGDVGVGGGADAERLVVDDRAEAAGRGVVDRPQGAGDAARPLAVDADDAAPAGVDQGHELAHREEALVEEQRDVGAPGHLGHADEVADRQRLLGAVDAHRLQQAEDPDRPGRRVRLVEVDPDPQVGAAPVADGGDHVAVGLGPLAQLDADGAVAGPLVAVAEPGHHVGRRQGHQPAEGQSVDHRAADQVVHRAVDLAGGQLVAGHVEQALGHLVAGHVAVEPGGQRLHGDRSRPEDVAGQVVLDGRGHVEVGDPALRQPHVGLAPALPAGAVDQPAEQEVGLEPRLLGRDGHAQAVVALGHRPPGQRRERHPGGEQLDPRHPLVPVPGIL